METTASTKFENKNKMTDSCFAISNQSDIELLKSTILESNTDLVETLAELVDRKQKANQKLNV